MSGGARDSVDADPFAPPKADTTPNFAPPSEDERIRRKFLNHEASIRGIGALWILGGAVAAFGAVAALIGLLGRAGVREVGFILFYALFAGVTLWTGIKVRRLRPEGRVPGLVLGGIGLIGIPIGTLISIYILYMLGSNKGAFVMSEEYREVIGRTPHIKYRSSIFVLIAAGLIFLAMLGAIIATVSA